MENGQQMRFTQGELELIKNTFMGEHGMAVLKVLRKVFLPEYDPQAPLGQAFDLWMTIDIKTMHPQDAYTHLLARNQIITHIEQQLIQLQMLGSMESKLTPEVASAKKKADGSQ